MNLDNFFKFFNINWNNMIAGFVAGIVVTLMPYGNQIKLFDQSGFLGNFLWSMFLLMLALFFLLITTFLQIINKQDTKNK